MRPLPTLALVAAALSALAALPDQVGAQSARVETVGSEPRIVVTVARSTRVPPDYVALLGVIEGTGESPADAVQRADRKVQAVLNAARPFGARGEPMTATAYGVGPAPNINGFPTTAAQSPYVARYTVRLQRVAVDQSLRAASALIAAGASSANAQSYTAAAEDSVRRVQVGEAVGQARRDAQALAAALGGRLGSAIEVTTSNTGPAVNRSADYVVFNRFEGPTAPPDVNVATTITVRYRLVLADSAQ